MKIKEKKVIYHLFRSTIMKLHTNQKVNTKQKISLDSGFVNVTVNLN